MHVEIWIAAISAAGTVVAAVFAAKSAQAVKQALQQNDETQAKIQEEDRKERTFRAFDRLQERVLDQLADIKPAEVKNIAEAYEEELGGHDVEAAFHAYRTMAAECEHFAVSVNTGFYDADLAQYRINADIMPGGQTICDGIKVRSCNSVVFTEAAAAG